MLLLQSHESSTNRNRRALICACAVVLTTLILVGGALGAIAIVYRARHADSATFDTEPISHHGEYLGELVPGSNPEVFQPREGAPSKPRIKIDDGGLWPRPPANNPTLTPDLIAIDDGFDQDIHIDDGTASPVGEEVPDGDNDITVIGEEEVTEVTDQVSYSGPDSSDSSVDLSSSDNDYGGRTYISSSFPYNGYYARGGQGNPPESLMSSWDREQASSGDSSGDGSQGDDEMSPDAVYPMSSAGMGPMTSFLGSSSWSADTSSY